MNKNTYLKLFTSCIPVKGHQRSIICDLQRSSYHFIPNDLYDFLLAEENKSLTSIFAKYGIDNELTIRQYIKFLQEEEYVFLCTKEEVDLFPPLHNKWDTFAQITNAIIDVSPANMDYLDKIFSELNDLGCLAVQLRFYDKVSMVTLKTILKNIEQTSIHAVELFLKYDPGLEDEKELYKLKLCHQRIFTLIIHSSPWTKNIDIPFQDTVFSFTEEELTSEKHCGVINEGYFTTNIEMFTEGLHYNSCLNRKISVDQKGNIKNCPSLPDAYGNIKDASLADALAAVGFKKYWNITKAEVAVCKDCEFRYICNDCRAYLEQPDDVLSKPLKCGYDPYTGQWKDWSTNPLKQEAMVHYGIDAMEIAGEKNV